MIFDIIKLFTDPIQLMIDGGRGLGTIAPLNHDHYDKKCECECDMCKNPHKYSPVIWPKWIFKQAEIFIFINADQ